MSCAGFKSAVKGHPDARCDETNCPCPALHAKKFHAEGVASWLEFQQRSGGGGGNWRESAKSADTTANLGAFSAITVLG